MDLIFIIGRISNVIGIVNVVLISVVGMRKGIMILRVILFLSGIEKLEIFFRNCFFIVLFFDVDLGVVVIFEILIFML